ncbi:hypothetical protein NSS91_15905 [Caldifermentibacillus hisashii]|uniref:hypothetical protein n=1 Tax=Caldifermentibacillus hisashii TaxID=996558 RepID=UPI0031FE1F75
MITYEKEIENKAIIKVAKNLIKLGVSLEKIKKATNLPESLCQNAVSPEAVGSQTIKDRGFIPL